jgi:hypothetical protein
MPRLEASLYKYASATDAEAVALHALTITLADAGRAQRFLDLTGVTPDQLRTALLSPDGAQPVLAALLGFLAAHEPDLHAVAAESGLNAADLMAARARLDPSSE